MKNSEGNNAGVRLDINSREQQENNTWINQQEQQAPQDLKYHDETAQQQQKNQYEVGRTDTGTHAAATGLTCMSSIRELGYLNQTSLLRKNFKIRGVIDNAGQIMLSFISL